MSEAGLPMPSDEQLRAALARRPEPRQMEADLASLFAAVERTGQRRPLVARIATRWVLPRNAITVLAVLATLVVLALALGLFLGTRHRVGTVRPRPARRAGLRCERRHLRIGDGRLGTEAAHLRRSN